MHSAATHDAVKTRLALAGAGYVDDERDSFGAVVQAVEALGGDPGLVLVFPTGVLDPADAAGQAQAAAGDAHVVGMTGTGAITAEGAITTGCSAIAFSPSLAVGVGVGTAIEPRTRGREAAEEALGFVDARSGHPVLLLFVDSDAGDQAEIVAGAYEVAGGRIPLAGGAAGGVVRAQIADGRALSASVVAVAIVASAPVGVGITHGCLPRGRPSIVTRSDGPTVLELDGRPAETVYLEKLGLAGVQLSEADFEALAMNHPIAEPELRGDVEPRYVRTRTPGGGLVCATSIERNAAVDVCDQTPEAIVKSAQAAVADALRQLPNPAEAALVFDCAARTAQFGNRLAVPEIQSLISAFGTRSPCLAGVYTRGEIGRRAPRELATMRSSSLPSAPPIESRNELLRRFVEASLRARIVAIVNRADSERELGELITAELCEAFEAEIAFVLARGASGTCNLVGTYGLQPREAFELFDNEFCRGLPAAAEPELHRGDDLLGLGIRHLVVVPFDSGTGVVGVARLHNERFDEAEVALLEAIAQSTRHALDRIRLAEERDQLYREAEERGRAARVLGSVADGVFLVDSAGIIRLWNRAAETITRLPAEEMLGRSAKDAIPGWEAVVKLIVVASAPAESGGRATTVPVEIDGRELWLSIAGVGFDDGTVYAFRDRTEERHLEQMKADFIATVSHELRTPIAAVHGAAKTIERRDILLPEESRRDLLAIISEQSERLVAIVNDILLASQVEDHRLRLTTERVDVAELAHRAIAAARTHAPKTLTLELVAPPAVPAVAADADKLAQVLTNLLANAVKYSPEGGRIELRLEPREIDLCITVRDEGLGIAESEVGRIFEKFYRVDPNMTRGVSGSGLGLYICRELVRRMGGSISVESAVGRGSTFFVVLPLASPAATS